MLPYHHFDPRRALFPPYLTTPPLCNYKATQADTFSGRQNRHRQQKLRHVHRRNDFIQIDHHHHHHQRTRNSISSLSSTEDDYEDSYHLDSDTNSLENIPSPFHLRRTRNDPLPHPSLPLDPLPTSTFRTIKLRIPHLTHPILQENDLLLLPSSFSSSSLVPLRLTIRHPALTRDPESFRAIVPPTLRLSEVVQRVTGSEGGSKSRSRSRTGTGTIPADARVSLRIRGTWVEIAVRTRVSDARRYGRGAVNARGELEVRIVLLDKGGEEHEQEQEPEEESVGKRSRRKVVARGYARNEGWVCEQSE